MVDMLVTQLVGEPSRINLLTRKIELTEIDFGRIKSVHYKSEN